MGTTTADGRSAFEAGEVAGKRVALAMQQEGWAAATPLETLRYRYWFSVGKLYAESNCPDEERFFYGAAVRAPISE